MTKQKCHICQKSLKYYEVILYKHLCLLCWGSGQNSRIKEMYNSGDKYVSRK